MGYPQDSEETIKKYYDYLKGKKVVIVGPAPHMRGWRQGELIDSYDVVVRVSKGYELKILNSVTGYGAVAVCKSGEIFYITYIADYYR